MSAERDDRTDGAARAPKDGGTSAASGQPQDVHLRPRGSSAAPADPFLRAANEDDDGYDPYSDRPALPEPLFARDPWA